MSRATTMINHPIMEELGLRWKRGGYQHRILYVLATSETGLVVATIRSRTGLIASNHASTRDGINQLREAGLVTVPPNSDLYRITKKGLDLSMEIGAPPTGTVTKVRSAKQKRAELYERPTYDGAELGKTCMRPGAYDAYTLPSLMGGKKVMPTWRNL